MRLVSRTNHPRSSREGPARKYDQMGSTFQTPRRQAGNMETASRYHYAKRQTCPSVIQRRNLPQSPHLEEYNASFKTSTQAAFDSRKIGEMRDCKEEWKILTLEEIRRQREGRVESIASSRKGSGRKLFVSISKSNRSSTSKERVSQEPKLREMRQTHTMLNSLSGRGRIVDTVELQMEENVGLRRFFC